MTGRLDTAVGRELLDDLGFLLVSGPPFVAGPAYLFVALRPRPTLRHFDPERIDFWQTADGHGQPASIAWATREPAVADHSWGSIDVIDRVNASNSFLSFGGSVLVARTAEAKIVVFSSDAPILAGGGHSQDWAFAAREVAGFLARLRAAADPRGSLESDLARMSPIARYCTFIADSLTRLRALENSYGWTGGEHSLLSNERLRLRTGQEEEWQAGQALARRLVGG